MIADYHKGAAVTLSLKAAEKKTPTETENNLLSKTVRTSIAVVLIMLYTLQSFCNHFI